MGSLCPETKSDEPMIYVDFKEDGWKVLPDKRRYLGSVDPVTGLPDGIGVLTDDRLHFYVGDLRQGKRHGRGYVVFHEVTKKKVRRFVHYTYEQVMSTAEFDSCGRVIHTGPAGHMIDDVETTERWVKQQDGFWEDDQLVREFPADALAGEPWCRLMLVKRQYHNGKLYFGPYRTPINTTVEGSIKLNGYQHFISPYDESALLMMSLSGAPLLVRMGQDNYYELSWQGGKAVNRFSFVLEELSEEA